MSLWLEGLAGRVPSPQGTLGLCTPTDSAWTRPLPLPLPLNPTLTLILTQAPSSTPTCSPASGQYGCPQPEIDSLPLPTSRAEKETKSKMEKITEIRDLTTQIMNIKR